MRLANSSPGTIINTAFSIFRSDVRGYLLLAIGAALWSILPIYGWAKSSQVASIISVKAYQKLLDIEESSKDISRRLSSRLWSFWGLNLLGNLYVGVANLISFAVIATGFYFTGVLRGILALPGNSFVALFLIFCLVLVNFLIFVAAGSLFFWLYGRVAFAELPLSIEPNRSVFGSIGRSWNLSRGMGRKIQVVLTIGTVILSVLWFGIPSLIVTGLASLIGGGVMVYLISWSLFVSLLQIVKAVIYYDLVCLQEGADLVIAEA